MAKYKVKQGDNLLTIAKNLNLSPDQVLKANPGGFPASLGQTIKVPSIQPFKYPGQAGPYATGGMPTYASVPRPQASPLTMQTVQPIQTQQQIQAQQFTTGQQNLSGVINYERGKFGYPAPQPGVNTLNVLSEATLYNNVTQQIRNLPAGTNLNVGQLQQLGYTPTTWLQAGGSINPDGTFAVKGGGGGKGATSTMPAPHTYTNNGVTYQISYNDRGQRVASGSNGGTLIGSNFGANGQHWAFDKNTGITYSTVRGGGGGGGDHETNSDRKWTPSAPAPRVIINAQNAQRKTASLNFINFSIGAG